MDYNTKAPNGVSPLKAETKAEAKACAGKYCINDEPGCQSPSPIADLLHRGASTALPCRDLVAFTGWTPREITRQIQRERASGVPICANGSGYYLPANDAELDAYLRSLGHRLREVQRTQRAIAATRQQRMTFGRGDL